MKAMMRAKNGETFLWPLLVQGWVNSVPFLKVAGRGNNIMEEPLLWVTHQGMLVESIGLRLTSEAHMIKVGGRSGWEPEAGQMKRLLLRKGNSQVPCEWLLLTMGKTEPVVGKQIGRRHPRVPLQGWEPWQRCTFLSFYIIYLCVFVNLW